MPRQKKVEYEKPQSYDIDHAIVVITWEKGHRPKMLHLDTVVIVGEHACAGQIQQAFAGVPEVQQPRAQSPAPLRNFEVSESDPEYLAFKARLGASPSANAPAPADYSPPVITNDDINREFEQRIKQETGFDVSVPDPAKLAAVS